MSAVPAVENYWKVIRRLRISSVPFRNLRLCHICQLNLMSILLLPRRIRLYQNLFKHHFASLEIKSKYKANDTCVWWESLSIQHPSYETVSRAQPQPLYRFASQWDYFNMYINHVISCALELYHWNLIIAGWRIIMLTIDNRTDFPIRIGLCVFLGEIPREHLPHTISQSSRLTTIIIICSYPTARAAAAQSTTVVDANIKRYFTMDRSVDILKKWGFW